MLENLYELFCSKSEDSVKGWDRLIEFLAVDNYASMISQLDHKFDWLFKDEDLSCKVMNLYKPSLLRDDPHDHLGDLYLEKMVSSSEIQKRGQFLTPRELAETLATMTIRETKKEVTVLDPAVGTGRLLIAARKYAPNGIFFGVDNDIRMLRIAMTNFAIHNIPGYLLHADALYHDIDLSSENGRYNWRFANKWHSHTDKLRPARQVPEFLKRDGPHLKRGSVKISGQQDMFEK